MNSGVEAPLSTRRMNTPQFPRLLKLPSNLLKRSCAGLPSASRRHNELSPSSSSGSKACRWIIVTLISRSRLLGLKSATYISNLMSQIAISQQVPSAQSLTSSIFDLQPRVEERFRTGRCGRLWPWHPKEQNDGKSRGCTKYKTRTRSNHVVMEIPNCPGSCYTALVAYAAGPAASTTTSCRRSSLARQPFQPIFSRG